MKIGSSRLQPGHLVTLVPELCDKKGTSPIFFFRKTSTLHCGTQDHMKLTTKCFEGDNWSNVSLEQFLECDQNLAFNRQTRMLADLSLIGCYSNIFNLTSNHLDRFVSTKIFKLKKYFSLESCWNRQKKTCQKWDGSVWSSINRLHSIYLKAPFIRFTLSSRFRDGIRLMVKMSSSKFFLIFSLFLVSTVFNLKNSDNSNRSY